MGVLAVQALLVAINPSSRLDFEDLDQGIFSHGLPVEATLVANASAIWKLGKVHLS